MRTPRMLLALVVHLALVGYAAAQEWPSRPLTMVVPFAAGGGADLLGRILAPPLSNCWASRSRLKTLAAEAG